MNINHNINDDLLVKYLLGEADPSEADAVQRWINSNEENRKYYESFQLIWEESKKLASNSTVDEQAAWQRFVARTQQETEAPTAPPLHRTIPLYRTARMWAAAVLLLLAGSAWLMTQWNAGNDELLTAHAGNSTITTTLPDGTVVILNRNATLSYPKKFDKATRAVALKGEAFFNVAANKQQPFVITANDAEIKVVGTTFNVKSTETRTEVIVETGIVEVAKASHAVRVAPQQKATVTDLDDQPATEQITDELYNYYRTKEFVCNSTPLWKLTEVLGEAYDVQISIPNKELRNMPLTATFRNEPLDDILRVVCSTFNCTMDKKGSVIQLK